MKFNEILNKYINLINCSSKDLATVSKLSPSIISRYKSGGRIPNNDNLKVISKALETLSNNKYSYNDILNDFNKSIDAYCFDFKIIRNNLNTLINYFNINVSELAKFLNFDASYLSRIRSGNRIPHNKQEFVNSLSKYILKKYNNTDLCSLINCNINELSLSKFKDWLIKDNSNSNEIDSFLQKLDDFNLGDFIASINFDKLKVPNIPFYKVKNKHYYGIEEMKQGELDFFKGSILKKSSDEIFMCSDMPMEDMAKDLEFSKKWMFAIAMSLKKGMHLNIIHNIDRPFKEMMLGLESWIPIYMTGQISPFYLKEVKNSVYHHLNYVSNSVALTGECLKGHHSDGMYYLTNNKTEVDYYKKKSDLLLKSSNSLMNIYKENNLEFKNFLIKDKTIKKDRIRFLASLPLFTIDDATLLNILKRNNINQQDIDKIISFKNEEVKHTKDILKENSINDNIYLNKNFDEEICLSIDNMFYNKKIYYNYKDYKKHLNLTKEYAKKNSNYKVTINENRTFKNITITILKDNYVTISKNLNPTIHFVIKHSKLRHAIENFKSAIKE